MVSLSNHNSATSRFGRERESYRPPPAHDYTGLGAIVAWGFVAMTLAQPIVLLQLGANVAGVVMVIASLHILRVNTTLLPPELRPALWRRVALVAMALFYGFFVTLWLSTLQAP